MHRKTAFVTGLAVGDYLGARAGRERYEQIRAVLDDLQIDRALEKGRALVELAVVRVQEARDNRTATVLPFPNAAGA
jgi:nitric oxide synthase oxygenase domain/subunit